VTTAADLIGQARARVAEVKRWIDNDVAAGDTAIQMHGEALHAALDKLDTAAALTTRARIDGEVSREALAIARAEHDELLLRLAIKELVEAGVMYAPAAAQLEGWIFDGTAEVDIEAILRHLEETRASLSAVLGTAAQTRYERSMRDAGGEA
jgi:hypothetical protein